jgi:predicted Zn-dependent protease
MIFPVRPMLGAELLAANRPVEAEAVFKEDLRRHPNNGWALYGLSRALAAEKRNAESAAAADAYRKAWVKADAPLESPAF